MPILLSFLLYCFSVVPYYGSISLQSNVVTYYPMPAEYYNAARFLAHVNKAGSVFDELSKDDIVIVTYPDRSQKYVVIEIKRYIDLYPQSPNMDAGKVSYVDMNGNGLTAYDVANQVYNTRGLLVLQTCLPDKPGRLFVIARPVEGKRGMR